MAHAFAMEQARVALERVAELEQPYIAVLNRTRIHIEDKPIFDPDLDRTLDHLDAIVTAARNYSVTRAVRPGSAEKAAATFRLGSIAGHRSQRDFYYRLAGSPAIRTICEVGFNAGHSTAIWLSANPSARVVSFDLFMNRFSLPCVQYLRTRFPDRLEIHRGDSMRTVPRAHPSTRCDLVHVDGRHSYAYTVMDFLHLVHKSHPATLFIFDDQCNPTACDAINAVPGEPTLATCDLVSSQLLEPLVTFYSGARQFALFRMCNASRALKQEDQPKLPCSPLCDIKWTSDALQLKWTQKGAKSRREQQQHLRDCRT